MEPLALRSQAESCAASQAESSRQTCRERQTCRASAVACRWVGPVRQSSRSLLCRSDVGGRTCQSRRAMTCEDSAASRRNHERERESAYLVSAIVSVACVRACVRASGLVRISTQAAGRVEGRPGHAKVAGILDNWAAQASCSHRSEDRYAARGHAETT